MSILFTCFCLFLHVRQAFFFFFRTSILTLRSIEHEHLTLNIKEHETFGSEFKFSDYYFRYVNLGESLQIFEPQFPHLVNGDYNNQPHNGTVRLTFNSTQKVPRTVHGIQRMVAVLYGELHGMDAVNTYWGKGFYTVT